MESCARSRHCEIYRSTTCESPRDIAGSGSNGSAGRDLTQIGITITASSAKHAFAIPENLATMRTHL
jgi:hypothetical protein